MVDQRRQYKVTCIQCDGHPVIGDKKLSPEETMPWLLNLHTSPPHVNHPLYILVDGEGSVSDEGEHEIMIRCLQCDGSQPYHKAAHRAPLALVGALTLMLHTRHEGHPIELTVDGMKYQ